MMEYHFKTHKEGTGFWAECIELKGCVTQGDSMEELQNNMAEALDLYLREPEGSDTLLPKPKVVKGRSIVAVAVDPGLALALQVRHARKRRKLSQRAVADQLGMGNLWSYQRLESSHTNPEFRTLVRIKAVFPEISLDSIVTGEFRMTRIDATKRAKSAVVSKRRPIHRTSRPSPTGASVSAKAR